MEKTESSPNIEQTSKADSIIKWIDSLAKIVVVITALLYVVGRSYTESYYSHMGLPINNLPLGLQEYLFMSTKSLSFLKDAAFSSIISILGGLAFSVGVSGVKELLDYSMKQLRKDKKKHRHGSSVEEKPRPDINQENSVGKENQEVIDPKQAPQTTEGEKGLFLSFQTKISNWLKDKLMYIIPTFVVLVFIMLIPSAKESGSIDSEYAIQNAPLGRVLLSQPSIPELSCQNHKGMNNEVLYDYGSIPVIGMLGENYLFVIQGKDEKKSILSIPSSQVLSINYVSFISLTPAATITPTTTIAPSPTVSYTVSPIVP